MKRWRVGFYTPRHEGIDANLSPFVRDIVLWQTEVLADGSKEAISLAKASVPVRHVEYLTQLRWPKVKDVKCTWEVLDSQVHVPSTWLNSYQTVTFEELRRVQSPEK